MAKFKYRDSNGVWQTIAGGDVTAVKYVEQTLTESQKEQARANIDADKIYISSSEPEVDDGNFWLDTSEENPKDQINIKYIPVSAAQGTMQLIWETVKSYLRNNDKLVYAHAIGSGNEYEGWNAIDFKNEVAQTEREGKIGYGINCSAFVNLILLGVPYEKSRYNPYYAELGKNMNNSAGYCFNLWGEEITSNNYAKYAYSKQMAEKFRSMGLGFRPNDDYSNIAPGDVIFFAPEVGKDADLSEIGHVAIVLAKHIGKYRNDLTESNITATIRLEEPVLYTFAEVQNDEAVPVRTTVYDCERLKTKGICYIGRPLYNSVPSDSRLITYYQDATNLYTFDTTEYDLYAQDMITISFDYTPSAVNEFVNIFANNAACMRYLRNITRINSDLELNKTYHYCVPIRLSDLGTLNFDDPQLTKVNAIKIACVNSSDTSTGDISNICLWYGLNGNSDIDKQINKKTENIGIVFEAKNNGVNVPNATKTIIQSITLPAGTYMIKSSYRWGWSTDNNHICALCLHPSNNLDHELWAYEDSTVTTIEGLHQDLTQCFSSIVSLKTETTYYLWAYQNCGTESKGNAARIHALKVI